MKLSTPALILCSGITFVLAGCSTDYESAEDQEKMQLRDTSGETRQPPGAGLSAPKDTGEEQ